MTEKINFHSSSLRNINWKDFSNELKKLKQYHGNEILQNELKEDIRKYCKGKNLLFVNSGTAALELALMSLKLNTDDEVILPSFTFSSCGNSILRANAKPVFCDVELCNLQASPNTIIPLINQKTKCIMIVEYAGIRADLNNLRKICNEKKIIIILDSAQSFAAIDEKYDNSNLADFVCYSFHDTKNFSCGEGGLLIVNNEKYLDDALIMYEKGTNRIQFLNGDVDKYSWCDIGSSFILSSVNLLLLKYQIKIADEILEQKLESIKQYDDFFKNNSTNFIKKYSDHSKASNFHIFWIILDNRKIREQLIDHFKKFKIETTTHYVPLHSTKFAVNSEFKYSKEMKTTNLAGNGLLRLPVISAEHSKIIINVFSKFKINKYV